MTVVQNAYANTSSILTIAKINGFIIDYLMPPFSPAELILCLLSGSIARGVLVGSILHLILYFFIDIQIEHILWYFFYVIAASTLLGLMGIISGIFANTFDQMNAATNYIIMPLSFLSGTFYSIHHLPKSLYQISILNPFFYIIDGFRYASIGYNDQPIYIGAFYILFLIIILFIFAHIALSKGWRIKN
jgi:ABC-2 type transport system permease protein